MFRFVAILKFRELNKKFREFGEVNPDNWPEFKVLFIEMLRMECKADRNCSDDILEWNMLAMFRRYQDEIKAKMPVEYYIDLFVTLRDLSRKHNPKLWDMIDNL